VLLNITTKNAGNIYEIYEISAIPALYPAHANVKLPIMVKLTYIAALDGAFCES
jgi:hypothetical protein